MDEYHAISNQLACFARALDERDWAAVSKIFAADVSFDYGEGEFAGIASLILQFRKYLDVCGPTQHLLGSVHVQLQAQVATTRAYVQARHQGAGDQSDRFFDSSGEYRDGWQKRDGVWLIVRRDVIWFMHKGDLGVIGLGRHVDAGATSA